LNETIHINRNAVWGELFIDELVRSGVRYACVSPGSRSTSLALACAANKELKSFVHVDERSGGFFALGLAKITKTPVLLVCTSGTAAAEFYPAVIESFQSAVPLIVCTADRPPELLDCGANQTIDQNNLYANHINWFFNAGLPEATAERLRHIRVIARRAVREATGFRKGPVHINLPFRKPFEPGTATDTVDKALLDAALTGSSRIEIGRMDSVVAPSPDTVGGLASIVSRHERGLLIVGPGDFDEEFCRAAAALAASLSYPILADGASQLRFGSHDKEFVFAGYDAYLKSEPWANAHAPDVILQFGGTVSSKGLEMYLGAQNGFRVHVDAGGRWLDPSNYLQAAVQSDPASFCMMLGGELARRDVRRGETDWLRSFRSAEAAVGRIRSEMIDCTEELFEGKVLRAAFDVIGDGSHVMISNSMPIRDLDYFVSPSKKNLRIHSNRGASGIDGINSTALGIATAAAAPVFLITGDLAFYHDLNGLAAAARYSIPLTVILINNNGGGIFELLPIAEYRDVFTEYFLTPQNANFSLLAAGYGATYRKAGTWTEFKEAVAAAADSPALDIIEIRTDAGESTGLRKDFWTRVRETLDESPRPA
jgi:2-succinyl-5-enolpyruvyl-6-hydroxy-3-cyclohexene-1-carboxylate synthase